MATIKFAGTLVISFIGLQTQEVEIQPVVNVVLLADTRTLDEVVVTGYGVQRKAHLQVLPLRLAMKRF